jgi:hypothetical protein
MNSCMNISSISVPSERIIPRLLLPHCVNSVRSVTGAKKLTVYKLTIYMKPSLSALNFRGVINFPVAISFHSVFIFHYAILVNNRRPTVAPQRELLNSSRKGLHFAVLFAIMTKLI